MSLKSVVRCPMNTILKLIILAAIILATATQVQADLSEGLVAHWTLDQGNGTIATDSSGNIYHGTLKGPTWTAQGKIGGACVFDGIDGIIETIYKPNFAQFTIAAWFY